MNLSRSSLTTEQRLRHMDRFSTDRLTEVAVENGFRVTTESTGEGWLTFRSTSVRGEIALGLITENGPFLLCVALRSVSKFLKLTEIQPTPKGFSKVFLVESREKLFDSVRRVYQESQIMGESNYFPLDEFIERTAENGNTETEGNARSEGKARERIGQSIFRSALLKFWNNTCPLTGITDLELLRASHIKPWSECETDADRLCPYNGLLLSAHWDAAFDKFLVTFDEDGETMFSRRLSCSARSLLQNFGKTKILLQPDHLVWMEWHRKKFDELDVT